MVRVIIVRRLSMCCLVIIFCRLGIYLEFDKPHVENKPINRDIDLLLCVWFSKPQTLNPKQPLLCQSSKVR